MVLHLVLVLRDSQEALLVVGQNVQLTLNVLAIKLVSEKNVEILVQALVEPERIVMLLTIHQFVLVLKVILEIRLQIVSRNLLNVSFLRYK